MRTFIIASHEGRPVKLYNDGRLEVQDVDGTWRDITGGALAPAPAPPPERWHDPYAAW